MAISLYIIIKSPESEAKNLAIIFFITQLVLNMIWTFLFFKMQSPLFAFLDISVLLILIFLTILYFYKTDKLASYLLIPYFLWTSFAAFLNYTIWKIN